MRSLLLVLLCPEALAELPRGWDYVGPSDGGEPLRLSLGLQQRNLDELERLFWAVSDPRSGSYGKFKSFEEVKALVAPAATVAEEVLGFFRARGLAAALNPGGDYVDVELSVAEAAALFAAEIGAYRSTKTQLVHHRALAGYSLPEALAAHVQYVFPLTRLPVTLRKQASRTMQQPLHNATPSANSDWPRDCEGLTQDGMITPGVLRKRYNVSMPTSSERRGSIATMLGYDPTDGCGFIQEDIAARNQLCGMDAPVTVEVKGDGKKKYCPDTCKKHVGSSCGESNLDVQTVTGLAHGVPTQFWIVKSGDPLDMVKQFNEDKDSALVLSCSFGDTEAQFDEDGGNRLETELQKAGVAGKTILFASGDSGVWAPEDATARRGAPAFGRRRGPSHQKFQVGYPVSSPYVTAVGGSQFVPQAGGDLGGDVVGAEMGVQTGLDLGETWITSGSSGGGISNKFAVPAYQKQFVSDWYDAASAAGTLPAASKWANTKAKRGYPDLAALAGLPGEGKATKDGKCTGECANYYLRQAGYWTHADGTSASCPAFAAMVAVMNEHRLAAGGPPMGAINTFLYQNADAFDDITLGDNKYYADSKGYGGFQAAKGWDPVTGLGAPNVALLVEAALAATDPEALAV